MSKNYNTYHQIIAGSLAFLLLSAITLKEAHDILHIAHHHHPECEATGNDKHLHDDSFAFQTCLLCHFSFQNFEQTVSPQIAIQSVAPVSTPTFAQITFFTSNIHFLPYLRGPPSA